MPSSRVHWSLGLRLTQADDIMRESRIKISKLSNFVAHLHVFADSETSIAWLYGCLFASSSVESQRSLLMMNHVTANKFIDHRGEILEKIRFLFRHQTLVDAVAQARSIPCATFDCPNQQPFPDPNNYGADEMNFKNFEFHYSSDSLWWSIRFRARLRKFRSRAGLLLTSLSHFLPTDTRNEVKITRFV